MKLAVRFIPVFFLSLLFPSAASAITTPSAVGDFNAEPSQTLQTKARSWSDPAFGDMGWTHNSGWGKFEATAGQIISIRAVASNRNIHPGITVWYRGDVDTIDDNYVADHFYPQNANLFVMGAKDETTGATLGNLVMKIAAYGFDKDKNTGIIEGLPPAAGKKDKVSGQLILNFKAKKTGTYIFVLGGFNPGPRTVDTALKYDVLTDVTITDPVAP
jgi:hypothetical protein